MIGTKERIELAYSLGKWLKKGNDPRLKLAKLKSNKENPWFTLDNLDKALNSIAEFYLDPAKMSKWLEKYPLGGQGQSKKIALITAGNIPLAGFHDFLSLFFSGHYGQIKLSSKDQYLFPVILEYLTGLNNEVGEQIKIVDYIKNPEGVIATGSNNTSRYFKSYFKGIPQIIRKNRNSPAVLTGDENESDWKKLGDDIFSYFGLGCRSVSFLYVPENFDFAPMMTYFRENYLKIMDHQKYRNNYEYNLACAILNNEKLIIGDVVLLFKSSSYLSRIATLNYTHYETLNEVREDLNSSKDLIQCVVANKELKLNEIGQKEFGQAQYPELDDYADGVDTMNFLIQIR